MVNVEEHLGLASDVVSKFYPKVSWKYDYEELQAVAYQGLVMAGNKFDDSKGIQFSTYAYVTIERELMKFTLRDKWFFDIRTVPGTNGTREYKPVNLSSLNQIIDEAADKKTEAIDLKGNHDNSFESIELWETVRSYLDDREFKIIQFLYIDDMKQKEIGSLLGVTQVQISRIQKKAINKLRKGLTVA